MAEPRKPRVIKTRQSPAPASHDPAPLDTEKTAVRKTSSKVSVEPLATPPSKKDAARKFPLPSLKGAALKDKLAPKPKPTSQAKVKAQAKAQPKPQSKDSGKAPTIKSATAAQRTPGEGAKVLAFPVPSFKRRRRTVWYSIAGVAAVLALVMGMALFSPVLNVKTVVFDGQKLVGEATLQLAVASIVNTPLPQVSEAEVQELLSTVVQVKSSRIEARPPSTLLVHIVERIPVALLKNGEEYLLVDQDGVQLGATKDPTSVALPLIDGGTAAIGQDTFRAMTAVLSNLPQSILEQLANATAKSPDAVELALSDGRSVIWGNASDMELKAQVLEALLTAPAPTAPAGKPDPAPAKVFDVSAPRHPVTR